MRGVSPLDTHLEEGPPHPNKLSIWVLNLFTLEYHY